MRRAAGWLIIALFALTAAGWVATRPRTLSAEAIRALPEGDAARGEAVFWAGGCTSCHAAADASAEERLKLGGGRELTTPFGTFVTPNISADPADGIGAWSKADFANAMMRGVSPEGTHFYPAFPYASYIRMTPQDVADLWAFLETLPPVAGKAPPDRLAFPYSIRRGVGLWKLLFLSPDPIVTVDTTDPLVSRGQYLVEGPGHCGECHTPRGALGAIDTSRWLAGGPAPEGPGQSRTSRPAGRSVTGRRTISSPISRRVSPRISIPWAGRWPRFNAIWQCSRRTISRQSPLISRQFRRCPHREPMANRMRE